jgi:type III secretion protein Q
MKRFKTLRSLDQAACRRLTTIARLKRAGLSARLSTLDARRRYVRLRVESGIESFEALIDLETYLSACLPALADLAWSLADDDSLLEVLGSLEPTLDWQQDWLFQDSLMVVDLVSTDDVMIGLVTAQGEVFCRDLPEALLPAPAPAAWSDALPVRLAVLLGSQVLRPALLAQIELGDVLLLQQSEQLLSHDGKALYRYSFQQEQIMIEASFDQPVAVDTHEPVSDPRQIPLRVEFVLQDLSLSLGELSALGPGHVFRLNPDAERNVMLRVNGVVVARGELVEMDQQLGVEIHTLPGAV